MPFLDSSTRWIFQKQAFDLTSRVLGTELDAINRVATVAEQGTRADRASFCCQRSKHCSVLSPRDSSLSSARKQDTIKRLARSETMARGALWSQQSRFHLAAAAGPSPPQNHVRNDWVKDVTRQCSIINKDTHVTCYLTNGHTTTKRIFQRPPTQPSPHQFQASARIKTRPPIRQVACVAAEVDPSDSTSGPVG